MKDLVSQSLETILSADPSERVAAVQERVRRKLEDYDHSLILFGTGQLGGVALERLHRVNRPPVAFADNNPALKAQLLGATRFFDAG